jgi:hypothetical protein
MELYYSSLFNDIRSLALSLFMLNQTKSFLQSDLLIGVCIDGVYKHCSTFTN